MYYNHNLRTNLQEWKNRLYRATYNEFGNQLKYFYSNIEKEKVLKAIIDDACSEFPYSETKINELTDHVERGANLEFENESDHVAFVYQQMKNLIAEHGYSSIQNLIIFHGGDFERTKNKIIEEQIAPLTYFLHDQLEKSSSTLYLIEKYKRRTEWFNKRKLNEAYNSATKNYEQIFEDDLRLFLFDQGIDYPFSTPKSPSGRADIVGSIDTSDPLVIEIKIFDQSKGYSKNRIKDGFTQIVKYTNDYNKDFGYLVIFNMDVKEPNIKLQESKKLFPPMINFNDKTFFFIVINLLDQDSASKIGQTEGIEITESDLIS
jgi:hypothetical protein